MNYSNKDLKPVSDKVTELAGKILKNEQDYEKWLYKICKIDDNEYN